MGHGTTAKNAETPFVETYEKQGKRSRCTTTSCRPVLSASAGSLAAVGVPAIHTSLQGERHPPPGKVGLSPGLWVLSLLFLSLWQWAKTLLCVRPLAPHGTR